MTHSYSAGYAPKHGAGLLLGGHQALGGRQALVGGGGLAHWLIRLFIWHEIWRLILLIWRIPGFGPVLVILIVSVLIAGVFLASRRRQGGFNRSGRPGGGGPGGGGRSPRDW